MTEPLAGLDIYDPKTLKQVSGRIQPNENVIGCLRTNPWFGDLSALILLNTHLLFVENDAKKSKSYEYLDIRKVELEDHKSFLMFTIETDLRAFDDRTFRIR